MPNHGQSQQQNKGRKNPGGHAPDDDESVETGENQAAGQLRPDSGKPRKPDPVMEIEDEEAEGDEDDADGLGERP
jgi:hypothetical protein